MLPRRNARSVMSHKGLTETQQQENLLRFSTEAASVFLLLGSSRCKKVVQEKQRKRSAVQDINWQWWCVNNGETLQQRWQVNWNLFTPRGCYHAAWCKLQVITSKHHEVTAKEILHLLRNALAVHWKKMLVIHPHLRKLKQQYLCICSELNNVVIRHSVDISKSQQNIPTTRYQLHL